MRPLSVVRTSVVSEHTRIDHPWACPEIRLRLVTPACALWRATDAELARLRIVEPYWAFAWAGGQALARALLDGHIDVRGRKVVDLGAGSGLVAIAALLAGASSAVAVDVDPVAEEAVAANAALNDVRVDSVTADWIGRKDVIAPGDVLVAGDVTYDATLARDARAWFDALAGRGTDVYVADPDRGFLDTSGLETIVELEVPADNDEDGRTLVRTPVYRIRP